MPEASKLNKREARLLQRLRTGAVLCCEVDSTEEGRSHDGRRWFVEPGGKQVGPATASALVEKGVVRAVSAGLFGSADAQSFEVAP